MIRPAVAVASLAVLVGVATTATAHHSTANYDSRNPANLKVTVKEVEEVNPHMRLTAVGPDGKVMVFEGVGVQNMYRLGWRRKMLKPGDVVTVNYSPLMAGQEGYSGLFWAVTTSDGKVVGRARTATP